MQKPYDTPLENHWSTSTEEYGAL